MVSFFSSTFGVFLSVLCDNLLLTVVVPILPELLREKDSVGRGDIDYFSPAFPKKPLDLSQNRSQHVEGTGGSELEEESCLKQLFHLKMLNENSQLGILFSSKAIVQLICNPLVGRLTLKIGYKVPICIGNFILFLCAVVFGFADSYMLFLIGRSFHGLASSMIAISGMALVAELYQFDADRTRFLGRVMGAAALGVLIGYPLGGFLYAFVGKFAPFLIIALLGFINTGLHALKIHFDWLRTGSIHPGKLDQVALTMIPTSSWSLWKDKSIRIIGIAIWLSTMSMAVLEPTLPVWLIDNIDPPKWQMGLVFVPDSLGYFFGTNFFGEFSLRVGRWKISMLSMATIGTACFLLPLSTMIWQLALPHFALGLGLGIVDASLMPLLAKLADEHYHAGYGTVYAFAQTAVAMAYSVGPLIGGQLVAVIGFPDLIRVIGFMNLLFCPFLLLLHDSLEHGRERGRDRNLPIQSYPHVLKDSPNTERSRETGRNEGNEKRDRELGFTVNGNQLGDHPGNENQPANIPMRLFKKLIQPRSNQGSDNNPSENFPLCYQRLYEDINEWE